MRFLYFISLILLLGCGSDTELQVDEAWQLLMDEKHKGLVKFRNIQLEHSPLEFHPLINISHNLQVSKQDKSNFTFTYIFQNHPHHFSSSNTIQEIQSKVNNHSYKNELLDNPEYQKLESEHSKINKQNQGHALWPKYREHFKNTPALSKGMHEIFGNYDVFQNNLNAKLQPPRS